MLLDLENRLFCEVFGINEVEAPFSTSFVIQVLHTCECYTEGTKKYIFFVVIANNSKLMTLLYLLQFPDSTQEWEEIGTYTLPNYLYQENTSNRTIVSIGYDTSQSSMIDLNRHHWSKVSNDDE